MGAAHTHTHPHSHTYTPAHTRTDSYAVHVFLALAKSFVLSTKATHSRRFFCPWKTPKWKNRNKAKARERNELKTLQVEQHV